MLHRLNKIFQGRKGFTLIEILIALAITGIMTTAIATITIQAYSGGTSARSHEIAIKQVENSINSISRYSQMGQKFRVWDTSSPPVEKTADSVSNLIEFNLAAGEQLDIRWNEWELVGGRLVSNKVVYTLDANGNLLQDYTYQYNVGGTPVQSTIGSFISTASGSWNTSSKIMIFNITATVGGSKPANESRSFQILPRPAQ
jgi:prepilin-type N-terminal cleavage/methylation domain-containing protein